ncbi:MAG: hypothetical protein MJ197_10770 [Bacteroidales bacterium]|nr:hypothetical protein [Bacteroidales bacterium]
MSQADIEKHIKEGVYVYAEEEKADFVQNCIACMCDEEEAGKMWENMEKVTHEGKAYRVDFCL